MKPIKVIIYIKVKFLGGIKMKLKKILAFSISALLFSLPISNYEPVFSYAESTPELSDNNSTYIIEKNGALPEGDNYKDLDFYEGEFKLDSRDILSFPSYVDLSTDPCFPALGNQGTSHACVGFATTYYQFSYEVNKLNGITSASDCVVYSPKWTYNSINTGCDTGAYMTDAFMILRNFGALKNSEFNYNYSYDYAWVPGDTNYSSNEMISERMEALKIRLSSLGSINLPNYGAFISNPNDNDLNDIKSRLNDGKILTITTKTNFNTKYGKDHNNSDIKICYRCYTDGNDNGGHAMAVVGYDDNAWCDVNNNGIAEDCEKGAFKLANSYGLSGALTDTNGYKWILYDAINAVSANTVNSWENNLSGTRTQALRNETTSPTFWYMNVAKYDVNYVGEIEINTYNNNLADCQFEMGRSLNGGSPSFYGDMLPQTLGAGPYNGKILFDYDFLCTPITSYLSGYKWYVNFTALRAPYSLNSKSIYNLKLVDNFNNILANYGYTNNTAMKYVSLSTMLGDVNYSGGLSQTDCDMIQQYLLHLIDLSNLQKVLADANQDGDIDMSDIVHIIQHM